jgi:hypothetical protein
MSPVFLKVGFCVCFLDQLRLKKSLARIFQLLEAECTKHFELDFIQS